MSRGLANITDVHKSYCKACQTIRSIEGSSFSSDARIVLRVEIAYLINEMADTQTLNCLIVEIANTLGYLESSKKTGRGVDYEHLNTFLDLVCEALHATETPKQSIDGVI